VVLARAVYAARTGMVGAHRRTIVALYLGALVIPGLFALSPQRLLGEMVWSALGVL
jgi:uncharacterized membrane protein